MTLDAANPNAVGARSSVVAARHTPETLELLTTRRSTPAIKLTAPGPSSAEIDQLIAIASRVPDHGKLAPWRFVVFTGAARAAAGDILAQAWAAQNPGSDADHLAMERGRFLRAPTVIAVISTANEKHKIPAWEQILSAGAVCQSLLVAAHAMGYAGQWLTEWYAYDPDVLAAFGLKPGERLAGYLYLGSTDQPAVERPRPDPAALTTRWTGSAIR